MGQANSSGGPASPPPRPRSPPLRIRRAARSSLASLASLLHPPPAAETTPTSTPTVISAPPERPRSRFRRSLGDLLHRPIPPSPPLSPSRRSRPRPSLPRVQVPELGLDLDQLLRTTAHGQSSPADTPVSPPRRLRSMLGAPRRRSLWATPDDRLAGLERRRRGEDQADVLSRLLSLAAAATAASLVGEDNQPATRDGTFDTFLESLQNGSIASALRGTHSTPDGGDGPDSPAAAAAPLNFFRMFRFGTSTDATAAAAATASRGSTPGLDADAPEGRMVPIIIVGIRSIPPGAGTGHDEGNIPPFLDALSSFPTPPTSAGDATDHVLQPPQIGTRFSHRRRASMGGFNFPAHYDNPRRHRTHAHLPDQSRPWSSLADSPPGPRPPPSTPATVLARSAAASGATTPATSTSPSSPTTLSAAPSRRESFARRPTAPALEPTVEEPQSPGRSAGPRRLSESDFTRYGSGAPRRRGVVEPDDNPGEGSRSWIIYVLGGSYPENHPILTTPSLFTDSPTYEDMMLLSSILGPAKPPVASEEDVASAPGLFRIRHLPAGLLAEAVDGGEDINLAADARCLVCLCDFERDEEARKLVQCEHLFHKICIDQWLTTGRNSCPLCRGEGVHESNKDGADAADVDDAPLPQPIA